MPSILFIDYDFPSPGGPQSRTLQLLRSLPAGDYQPLVVAGPVIADRAGLTGTAVHHVDGNGNWISAAVDAVDDTAAASAAVLAVLTKPDTAFVAAELSARWDVPWIADVPQPAALTSATRHQASPPVGTTLRSVLGSASAFTLRTPAAVGELRRSLPELGLKHIACVPERLHGVAATADATPCALSEVLEHIVPRRLRLGGKRHLRVVSYSG